MNHVISSVFLLNEQFIYDVFHTCSQIGFCFMVKNIFIIKIEGRHMLAKKAISMSHTKLISEKILNREFNIKTLKLLNIKIYLLYFSQTTVKCGKSSHSIWLSWYDYFGNRLFFQFFSMAKKNWSVLRTCQIYRVIWTSYNAPNNNVDLNKSHIDIAKSRTLLFSIGKPLGELGWNGYNLIKICLTKQLL